MSEAVPFVDSFGCINMHYEHGDDRIFPSAQECTYTSCYCEENVWKMCEYVAKNSPKHLPNCKAVFISNEDRLIPLWCQVAAKHKDEPIIWDYHVIFVHDNGNCAFVYDLDSTLPFPSIFDSYSSSTFRNDQHLKPQFHRSFRVIPSSIFLNTFASDRSHMKGSDGQWNKEPPDYPCICTADDSNNLESFINMDRDQGIGQVLTLDEFVGMFSRQTPS